MLATLLLSITAALTMGATQASQVNRALEGDDNNVLDAHYEKMRNIAWLRVSDTAVGWASANSWAQQTLYDFAGWRMPGVEPVTATLLAYGFGNNGSADVGYNQAALGWATASEVARPFYAELGSVGVCTPNVAAATECVLQTDHGLTDRGGFPSTNDYSSDLEPPTVPFLLTGLVLLVLWYGPWRRRRGLGTLSAWWRALRGTTTLR
jgi:hypothetical protein